MSTYVLDIKNSQVFIEETDGMWCVSHPDLGLVVYGDSAQLAMDKLDEAIGFLFDILLEDGGPDAVRARFDRAKDMTYELNEITQKAQINLSGTFTRMPPTPPRRTLAAV